MRAWTGRRLSRERDHRHFCAFATGQIIHSHQMDGVLPIGAETGLMKAKTALYARSSSAAVAQRFNTVDGRLDSIGLGQGTGLSYYFVAGGLPIVVDHQLIGAMGVGGGNADEQCAYQALVKVLGPQPEVAQPTPPAGGGRGGAGGGAGGGGGRGGRGGGPQ